MRGGYINKQTNKQFFYSSDPSSKTCVWMSKTNFCMIFFVCLHIFPCNVLAVLGGPFRMGLGSKRVNGQGCYQLYGCINVIMFSSTIKELNPRWCSITKVFRSLKCTAQLFSIPDCFTLTERTGSTNQIGDLAGLGISLDIV